jgi:hypothetical protein
MFSCSTNSDVKLLVPSKQIPTEAIEQCKGSGKFGQQGSWKFDKMIEDFEGTDVRLAIDSKKAVEDISRQGFHIARVAVITKTTEIRKPKSRIK